MRVEERASTSNKSNFIVGVLAGCVEGVKRWRRKRKTNKFFKRFYVAADNIKTNKRKAQSKLIARKLLSRLSTREWNLFIYLSQSFSLQPFGVDGNPPAPVKGNRLMDAHKRPSSALRTLRYQIFILFVFISIPTFFHSLSSSLFHK